MQSDWEIKGARTPVRPPEEFAEGEHFYTLLFREGEGFRREDLSEEAWAARNDNIQPFSFWRCEVRATCASASEALKKTMPKACFARSSPTRIPHSSTPATSSRSCSSARRCCGPWNHRTTTSSSTSTSVPVRFIAIRNPNLSFDQIPDVQREVSDLLANGFSAQS